uniref:Uncharacterized protein n=1 Tax=virus sp. ctrcb4 TaxID=2825824 RepID=A0A8S5RP37_9VIRU|nr:MAG TPA: hypothetical protein [virus sp. ctrcb4]DAR12801.1 MAG TPA: hypothetical protein [Crassvirales sp.]
MLYNIGENFFPYILRSHLVFTSNTLFISF